MRRIAICLFAFSLLLPIGCGEGTTTDGTTGTGTGTTGTGTDATGAGTTTDGAAAPADGAAGTGG